MAPNIVPKKDRASALKLTLGNLKFDDTKVDIYQEKKSAQ